MSPTQSIDVIAAKLIDDILSGKAKISETRFPNIYKIKYIIKTLYYEARCGLLSKDYDFENRWLVSENLRHRFTEIIYKTKQNEETKMLTKLANYLGIKL